MAQRARTAQTAACSTVSCCESTGATVFVGTNREPARIEQALASRVEERARLSVVEVGMRTEDVAADIDVVAAGGCFSVAFV